MSCPTLPSQPDKWCTSPVANWVWRCLPQGVYRLLRLCISLVSIEVNLILCFYHHYRMVRTVMEASVPSIPVQNTRARISWTCGRCRHWREVYEITVSRSLGWSLSGLRSWPISACDNEWNSWLTRPVHSVLLHHSSTPSTDSVSPNPQLWPYSRPPFRH